MKKTIEELVILSRSGNSKAKEELVKMTIDDAYVVARSLCHSEADAQDVLQDCYMQAFAKLEMLNNPSSFRAWLKTMVRNRCFDLYKSYRMQNERTFSDYGQENDEGDIIELDPIDVSSVYQPEVQLDMKTKREIVFSIMNTLPAEQREVVYLMYYENRKISEIAQQLQCTENTVKSRLRYAKAKIECDTLILDDRSRSDTIPYNINENATCTVEHEATVSKISEEELFYLMSRGLSEAQATEMIVMGFLEPFTRELPMEYAVELNQLLKIDMSDSIG